MPVPTPRRLLPVIVAALALLLLAPAAHAAGPWSLFDASTQIVNPAADDPDRVEVGVRFSVAAPPAGSEYSVSSVRFYRDRARGMVENRVFVYDDGGTQVGQGVAIGEGPRDGVVDVALSAPVRLSPGVTYTASYLADGYYAEEQHGFDDPRTVGPIAFPANAGVYQYGGGFPTSTWEGTNYYVSPVVTDGSSSPPPPPRDTTVPVVTITSHADGATVKAKTSFYVRANLYDAGYVISSARILVDGVVKGSIPNPSSPSTVNFPITLTKGTHTVVIQATDPAGIAGSNGLSG